MFSLSELVSLSPGQASSKLLKPWWEVFMDHLVLLMLMVSVLAGTLLLSRDRVVCLPLDPSSPSSNPSSCSSSSPSSLSSPSSTPSSCSSFSPPPQGRRTQLDYQQYVYVSQVCYHQAPALASRLAPYLTLLQSLSLVLLASGGFWLHFPLSSARVEHFLAILAKCSESPWTSRALSHAARHDPAHDNTPIQQEEEEEERGGQRPPPTPSSLLTSSRTRQSSLDSGTDSPLLGRPHPAPPSPCPSSLSRTSSLSSVCVSPRAQAPRPPAPRQAVTLDRSDGEQARALFERVRRFRAHCENSDVIYKVYLCQTAFKLLMVVVIVGYTAPLLSSITFCHTCLPQAHGLTGYAAFQCTHALAALLHKLMLAYLCLVGLYGLLGLYALYWSLYSSLRQYSFSRLKELCFLGDVPDLCNDLAFLLHMSDQYDPLLAQRLSVFLSPVSETRLLDEGMRRRWGAERLVSMTTTDGRGRSLLQLVALPRLPPALFSLSQVEVLKLELVREAKITGQVTGMTSLRELHLYLCSAAVEPGALAFLQEHLESLHLTFPQASDLPPWALSLRGLQELHLTGRLGCEGGVGRGWALGSLRQLRHLRVLVLRGMLPRVPGELGEVGATLVRLEVHNEGCRLLVLTGLRRLGGLTELVLQGCQLERLPSALLALPALRSLDLGHNSLRCLDELPGLGQLRRLSSLCLSHNRVLVLPAGVGLLRGLELLDLGHNQLSALPPALFILPRLRRLLLGGNLLEELPGEVGALGALAELDLSGNRLESLPAELWRCAGLRSLNLAHNSLEGLPPGLGGLGALARLDLRCNSLQELPEELGGCGGLRGGGRLLVEDWLLHTLPQPVRDFLLSPPGSPLQGTTSETKPSRPESDSFPYFSAAQWSFSSAMESRI
ncbi:volume-regulated anion channel subunit LRRC8D [Osmerus eperlanus]|uniref:volume-regulated anion channel subunit LRRC8D n=1 Tax=Osmerus eperlanus TaxID=29151 RepID=UPI002E11C91B